jgi:hypothetical protein
MYQKEQQKEAKAKANAGEWVTKKGKMLVVVEPPPKKVVLIEMDDTEVLEPFKRMERVNWADE